jgi:hypothetical protein
MSDYVITHKDYPIVEDDFYKALCVGGFRKDGWLCAADGNNIEQYNDRLNETTGLYWIWKNTKERTVGLSHYRRYFKDGELLTKDRAEQILKTNDLIMAPIRIGWSILENIRMTCGSALTNEAHAKFRGAIEEKQPGYVEAFDRVMDGNFMYYCGMFVTSRKVLNAYCKWLFSFLPEVVENVDVSGRSGDDRRVCGYFSEAMWTVWLQNQALDVYEMPLEVRG